jgi:hypothetical protein
LSVLASSSPAVLISAVIGAIAALASALLLVWVALRAQSAEQQLEKIDRLLDKYSDVTVDRLARELHRTLRETLGSHPRQRRWYDSENED